MTTSAPNPALVAAAPTLIQIATDVKQFLNTTLTGDPLQIPARAAAANLVLMGQIQLLFPELAVAEEAVMLNQANTGLDGIINKLKALSAPASPTPPAG